LCQAKSEIMRGRMTSGRADSSSKGGDSTPLILNPVAPPVLITSSQPQDPLLQKKYQRIVRKYLDQILNKLFAEFTGLHFHIAWAPVSPHEWTARTLPTACSVCCRLSGAPLRRRCQTCGPRQLAQALKAAGAGHRFTCKLGVHNYWFALHVRGQTLGIAYLQALHQLPAKPSGQKRSSRANPRTHAIVMNHLEFGRATRLLHLIVQHVQTASLSDLRKADLTSAGQAVVALEKEQARLHETLQRHLPQPAATLHRAGAESHPDQIVHQLLDYTEQNYGKPITLRSYSRELGMNAAYLSALFSHAVGVSFRTLLTERRMAKARELLGDATKNLSDVATAVGYASENRFRIAFKKATGLSPKLWRETMQPMPRPGMGK
jgi:AraC-like DNA-binding protein